MSSSTRGQLSSRPLVMYAGEEKNFTVWDANREILRQLFLSGNCTLSTVKRRMEAEHGFPIFPLIDYETTLRDRFHFRKNLKASDWCSIGYHVEKRRLQGKPSSVYLGNTLQEPRKVEKEIRRYTKRSVLQYQIRMNHLPSPLRQNILIRTPSPKPQSNVGTMIRALPAVDITVLCQMINALRVQSPSTEFISFLMTQTMPNTAMEETIEIARCISVSTLEISPSLREHSDLALLSQSCFLLSNNNDSHGVHSSIAQPHLNWIGFSAELHVLKHFFSMKSSTVESVWDSLYVSSIRLRKPQAYSILVEIGLSIDEGRWITRRSSCLIDAVNMKAKDRVADLVERHGIDPNLAVPYDQVPEIMAPAGIGHDMIAPLTLAAYGCDLDIIKILLKHGANVNPPFAEDEESSTIAPLFAALQFGSHYDERIDEPPFSRDGEPAFIPPSYSINLRHNYYRLTRPPSSSLMHCVCALLDAGSYVDIHESCRWKTPPNPWGWFVPGQAAWLIDYVWVVLPEAISLLAKLSEKSVKMETEVTVAGICLAAKQSHENLRKYLDSRPFPNGKDRTAILQIAISEAAARGLSETVSCLLQLGVDHNVQCIEDELESRSDHRSWHPAFRPLSILDKFFFTDSATRSFYQNYKIVNSFRTGDSKLSMTAVLSLVEVIRPQIEKDGRGLILLFLRRAYQQNFATCAKVCDMAWSWGAPPIFGDDGRDALHYAISHNCCLDMVKFLIARDYQVHSKFAYDYGYHSPNLSLATEIEGPASPCRSSMLGDALISFADDRVAIVNFLLDNEVNTESTRDNYSLLEDVDESVDGYTPLLTALTTGRLAIAERLLDKRAKVDNPVYSGYRSPLEIACDGASQQGIPLEFIENLIRRGAAIDTALHTVASAGNMNLAALLLRHGADVNVGRKELSGDYTTPLDNAAM
ncbi:hypothetical protein F4678DRAFT_466461 [Xylaria arbuscula]|nr:hypothetical protein F4678DRAFT_466461 [Xylaria arbuscula]